MSAREEGRKRKSAREDGRGRKRRRSTKQERRRRRGEERLSGMMKNKAEVCGGSYRTMRSWEFAIPLEVCGDSDGLMRVCTNLWGSRGFVWLVRKRGDDSEVRTSWKGGYTGRRNVLHFQRRGLADAVIE